MRRMLWLAQSRWIFEFQRLWIGPEYTFYVLNHRILKLYVLIPVIFILHSHTASFRQFTGNVTTSHTGKLPERIYWYFWKGPVHTWSLYGNLLVIFRKSLYVWKGLMKQVHLLEWVIQSFIHKLHVILFSCLMFFFFRIMREPQLPLERKKTKNSIYPESCSSILHTNSS